MSRDEELVLLWCFLMSTASLLVSLYIFFRVFCDNELQSILCL